MGEMDRDEQLQLRLQRERQYQLDRITFQYAEAYRAGRAPRIEDYIRQYPTFAAELAEFALYFHTVGSGLPDADASPATELSPAAQRAQAHLRGQQAAASAPAEGAALAIEGLVSQGATMGYSAQQLAGAVGLSIDLLAKLEAHAIAASTIPRTLIQRLANVLKVTPETVVAFVGLAPTAQAGAFYYADQPPTQQQQSFLDAVQASTLSPDLKLEWAKIASDDAGSAP
jgi:hypothetical protein